MLVVVVVVIVMVFVSEALIGGHRGSPRAGFFCTRAVLGTARTHAHTHTHTHTLKSVNALADDHLDIAVLVAVCLGEAHHAIGLGGRRAPNSVNGFSKVQELRASVKYKNSRGCTPAWSASI